jgi:hypothetical protein
MDFGTKGIPLREEAAVVSPAATMNVNLFGRFLLVGRASSRVGEVFEDGSCWEVRSCALGLCTFASRCGGRAHEEGSLRRLARGRWSCPHKWWSRVCR